MAKIFLALVSAALMLCLPGWFNGETHPSLQSRNFKKLTTYTEPYYQLVQKVDEHFRPKKVEAVVVSAWQDHEGNMHFSSQGQAPLEENVQNYEVQSYYSGRFALPAWWVWTAMLIVWLAFFVTGLLCLHGLSKFKQPAKQARTLGVAERESAAQGKLEYHQVEYENTRPPISAPRHSKQAIAAAHRVLETNANASPEEIKYAYHSKMKQYHPDKVAHLGKELQEVARKKAIEINHAYGILVD